MKTATEAYNNGYMPLSGPYFEGEMWMADNVVADMERGGIDHIMVEEEGGISVWRQPSAPPQVEVG